MHSGVMELSDDHCRVSVKRRMKWDKIVEWEVKWKVGCVSVGEGEKNKVGLKETCASTCRSFTTWRESGFSIVDKEG